MPEIVCDHNWEDIDFLVDGSGIACSGCETEWILNPEENISDSALLVLWNSAKLGLTEIQNRNESILSYLRDTLSLEQCSFCDAISDRSSLKKISKEFACVKHIAFVLSMLSESEMDFSEEEATDWVNSLYNNVHDLKSLWSLLNSILHFPLLKEMLDGSILELKIDASNLKYLDIDKDEIGIEDLVEVLAKRYSLDKPKTDSGIAWLIGITAEIAEDKNISLDELYENLIPQNVEQRALLTVDLGVQSMPVGTEFSSEMADELLVAFTERIYEENISDLKEFSAKK